jgi:hypothetical protein
MSENIRELSKQYHDHQAKYAEFLLAAPASCIAYAVHRTTGAAASKSMIVLAAAVLSWIVSIWAGLMNRRYFLQRSTQTSRF